MYKQEQTFTIEFDDISLAESGSKALRLRDNLLDISDEVEIKVIKEDPNTQDFGSILVLVLGTPAVFAIAKGIADFIRRERASITIKGPYGEVIATGLKGEDAARIAEAMGYKK